MRYSLGKWSGITFVVKVAQMLCIRQELRASEGSIGCASKRWGGRDCQQSTNFHSVPLTSKSGTVFMVQVVVEFSKNRSSRSGLSVECGGLSRAAKAPSHFVPGSRSTRLVSLRKQFGKRSRANEEFGSFPLTPSFANGSLGYLFVKIKRALAAKHLPLMWYRRSSQFLIREESK